MFSARKLLLASVLVSSAFCVVPMSASADLFCVQVDPCGGAQKTTIQIALTDAAANENGEDVIWVGSGGSPYAGPFVYNDPEKVTLLGVGATKPTLTSGGTSTALQLLGNTASKVQNFSIIVPAFHSSQALNWTGLAEDLEISYTGADLGVRGVLPAPGATLKNSAIDINNTGSLDWGHAVEASFATGSGVTLDNVTISGNANIGVRAGSGGVQVSITRSTISAAVNAVRAGSAGTQVTASQSVLRSIALNPGEGIVNVRPGASFSGDHLTLHGDGTESGLLVDSASPAIADDASLDVTNSIVSNVLQSGISSGEGAILTSAYTMLPQPLSEVGGGSEITGIGTLIGVPNYFNAAAGNFRLTAPQTSIDAGDPADATTLDRAGSPRIVDGDSVASARSDLGALEYQAAAPAVTIHAPATVPEGAVAAFSATATDSDPGDTISYSWNFGDGTATGPNVAHAFATFGAKTVTVIASDQIGRQSSATAVVNVSDITTPALKITGVKLNKRRTALEAKLACPASELSCKFRYSLTTAKKIKVGGKRKIVTLAKTRTVTTTGAKTKKLSIKLNKTARKLLAKGTLKIRLRVTITDAAQNSATKSVLYTAKKRKA